MANLKEMRVLIRAARRAGCTAERRNSGHTRLTAPNGAHLDLSFSPGTQQGVKEQQRKVAKFLALNIRGAA